MSSDETNIYGAASCSVVPVYPRKDDENEHENENENDAVAVVVHTTDDDDDNDDDNDDEDDNDEDDEDDSDEHEDIADGMDEDSNPGEGDEDDDNEAEAEREADFENGTDEEDGDDENEDDDEEEETDRRSATSSVTGAVAIPETVEVKGTTNKNRNGSLKGLKAEDQQENEDEGEGEEAPLLASPNLIKGKKRKRSQEGTKDDDDVHTNDAGIIPSVKDLEIPFRAIKRIMKTDPDIGTVQNEAAIVTTYALELFVKKIVTDSYANSRKRGRNTVKYEDLAETRAKNQCLNFLDTLLP